MAPEQANAEEVDGRCDLFSLGAVLYRSCTGRLPFDGKDTLSVLAALATKTPVPPHKLAPQTPAAFSELVMRLLAKDRDDRPQSAREVVEALEAIERGDPPEPEPLSIPEETAAEPPVVPKKRSRGPRKKKRRHTEKDWGRVVLLGSLVFLAVAVVVLVLGILRHAHKGRESNRLVPPSIRSRASAQSETMNRLADLELVLTAVPAPGITPLLSLNVENRDRRECAPCRAVGWRGHALPDGEEVVWVEC